MASKRETLYPEIKRLREDEGLKWREIGARLGLSLSTVHDYYSDPTGETVRARKAKNDGVCSDCGGPTRGGGAKVPPKRCVDCVGPPWTREGILEALRQWGDDHGGIPPREIDAHIGHEGHGRLPYFDSVRRCFGSWNVALLAAGYEALRCDRRPETQQQIEEAVRSGARVVDVADRFGVTPHAIYQRLRIRGLALSDLRA
jgi:hypothetical protein